MEREFASRGGRGAGALQRGDRGGVGGALERCDGGAMGGEHLGLVLGDQIAEQLVGREYVDAECRDQRRKGSLWCSRCRARLLRRRARWR